ncbi:MAG TPA: ABC transporter ATP-binding protein/permease, partial [Stellaceae bacterium]
MRDAVRFGRVFWSLARPYFVSEDRWAGCGLLAVLVALNFAVVGITVWFNNWDRLFYNALQDRDHEAFLRLIATFLGMGCVYIAVGVYQVYLSQILQIRWRRWLTDRHLAAWLDSRAYYRLELEGGESGTDNPDQRIAEDLRQFVERTLAIAFGMLSCTVTLASFLTILWNLSGTVTIPLGIDGAKLHVQGIMVWAALVYAAGGTWLTHRIGRPLAGLNFAQQRVEADFRFGLVRLRENAEGIALYRGEADELRLLRGRFAAVVANWMRLTRMQKRLAWFGSGFNEVAIVFPYLIAAPRYFLGALSLGEMMQSASAFKQVQQSLSYLVYSYPDIAAWKAVVDRLAGFEAAIERARREAAEPAIRLTAPHGGPDEAAPVPAAAGLEARDLTLRLPDGTPLLQAGRVAVARGERVLVAGASGLGKSTLFRAIAGIWPFGGGEVRLPCGARPMFLPQRPYLPVGTLRDVVRYPDGGAGAGDDAAVCEALVAVGLSPLAERLDETAHWASRLSLGEQQRIAAARVLLQRPDWLFLDEATSALDEEA